MSVTLYVSSLPHSLIMPANIYIFPGTKRQNSINAELLFSCVIFSRSLLFVNFKGEEKNGLNNFSFFISLSYVLSDIS